jgi:RNA polymerase sigma-70 factor (ECF subfamily)
MLVENQRVPNPADMCQIARQDEHAAHDLDQDADLIARVAREDRQALTDLYEKRKTQLTHYLLEFTADYSLVEEILQDIFLAVWKNAQSYQGAARGQVWLWGIARRQAWKTLRRHKALVTGIDDKEWETLHAPEPEPEAALLAQIDREALNTALERAAPIYREVLLLRYSYDFSYQEIASVQQIPVGTVRSRLNAAKRAVRALLSGEKEARG